MSRERCICNRAEVYRARVCSLCFYRAPEHMRRGDDLRGWVKAQRLTPRADHLKSRHWAGEETTR